MRELPNDIEKILLTVAELYALKGESSDTLNVFKTAKIDIEETDYDNWDGGQYGYTLILQVAVSVFSRIEDRLDKLEEEILEKLKPVTRKYDNQHISKVVISPALIDSQYVDEIENNVIPEPESIKFWEPGFFRLFLSHTSKNKLLASQFQKILMQYGISCFIAHEDIKPSKEWLIEIETALSSMDGLLGLITEDFISSNWCDQEIGIAIGRKKIVLPIRYGKDPYGFIGKYQAITFDNIQNVSVIIFDILIANVSTKSKMCNAIVSLFCNSESFAGAKANLILLEKTAELLSNEMKKKLLSACSVNSQIKGSFGVVAKVKKIVGNI